MEKEENIFFRLIHVGRAQQDPKTGRYHINCYFQSWSIKHNCSTSDEIILHSIDSTFAGELVCGTLWTNRNIKTNSEYVYPSEYQKLHIGPNKLYAKRLKNIIDVDLLTPQYFWRKHADSWTVCIQHNNKTFIIPYFELIRTVFYQTSYRVTSFLLSQVPFDQLCRPLVSPSIDNSFIARYYVATKNLTAPEARLLGNILFNSSIRYAFNLSQAYWRKIVSGSEFKEFDKTDEICIGTFESLSFHAKGYNFTSDGIDYFWTEALDIAEQTFCFKKLLFYPLHAGKNEGTLDHDSKIDLPFCSDVFKSLSSYTKPSELRSCMPKSEIPKSNKVSVFGSRRQERRAVIKADKQPLVVRRPAWAMLAPDDSHFITDGMVNLLKFKAPSISKNTVWYTDIFRKLIFEFTSRHYSVSYMTLNNQNKSFGKNLSVMPVDKYGPLPNHIYNGKISIFSLVQIHLNETYFYIAQPFPRLNPELTIIIIKQNLSQPSDSEFNTIFDNITPVRGRNDYSSFHKRMKYISKYQTTHNTGLLVIPVPTTLITADFCLTIADNVISRFRKRIEFFLATFLRFPQGVNRTQMTHISTLSRNMCKTPDPLLLTTINLLWYSL